jgi:hypothetical protein
LTAASATFAPGLRAPGQALNAALCFFRVRFMSCSLRYRAF